MRKSVRAPQPTRARPFCGGATGPTPNHSKLRGGVAFENWSGSGRDRLRLKRLLVSSSLGFLALLGCFVGLVKFSPKALAEAAEEDAKVVEVELAKEPEPEPPPPPAPPELRPHHSNPGPRLQKLETPTTISDEKVQEKDAKPSNGGSSDPYEKGSGDGSSGPQKAVVEAPVAPPPPPPPKIVDNRPRPVSETDTPPEPIGIAPIPEMPAEAKAAGVEGTVVIKFVVTETGAVTDVRVLKGPPELHAVCVAAVKALRFKPGHSEDGVVHAFTKIKSFRFRLRT
jgi:protein TonB